MELGITSKRATIASYKSPQQFMTKHTPNWYALYTRSRAEKKAHALLLEKGFTTFLPLMTTVRQWSDRKKKVQVPLLPSYLFIYCREDQFPEIIDTSGIVTLVKHLGKPAIIQDHEIENLKILSLAEEKAQAVDIKEIVPGASIEITHGPFKGLQAHYARIQGEDRVVIRIESLSNCLSVNVPLEFIQLKN